MLSEEWYDKAYDFCDDYAMVKQNGKYNFIDENGKLLSKTWYKNFYSFFARIS